MNSYLPLVNMVNRYFSEVALDKVLVIACQHILPTTHLMLKELFSAGLNPNNVKLIGKCYSTNPETFQRCIAEKIQVSPYSMLFNGCYSFDEQFQSYIQHFLEEVLIETNFSKYSKIIILDDGGELIIQSNKMLKNFVNVVGIEQTSSGIQKIKNLDLNFPVLNLAYAPCKSELEPPLIAECFLKAIQKRLKTREDEVNNVLILGNGILGKAIGDVLEEDYRVARYDTLPQRRNISSYELVEEMKVADMVIGCTGTLSASDGLLENLKPGVILVSLSSADREFNGVRLRKLAKKTKVGIHQDITTAKFNLLNNGFPINFDEDYESVDNLEFQFIRALIVACIYEASSSQFNENKIVPINKDIQNLIKDEHFLLFPNRKEVCSVD